MKQIDREKLYDFLREMEFNRLLSQVISHYGESKEKKVEKYKNQNIDINFDIIRELPASINFDNARWFFHVAGVQYDLVEPYLDAKPNGFP